MAGKKDLSETSVFIRNYLCGSLFVIDLILLFEIWNELFDKFFEKSLFAMKVHR